MKTWRVDMCLVLQLSYCEIYYMLICCELTFLTFRMSTSVVHGSNKSVSNKAREKSLVSNTCRFIPLPYTFIEVKEQGKGVSYKNYY